MPAQDAAGSDFNVCGEFWDALCGCKVRIASAPRSKGPGCPQLPSAVDTAGELPVCPSTWGSLLGTG